ncbi:DUF4365 domain-containing protein [Alteromonas sp. 009811495]|uniref:DUF4365 domain-containing protein n=1 Tax=Alteromonas sp. 009811495 TaxID=3002962 RepID=UPI00237DCDBE|nr:DUF4365 domain-containing protein [Alteromonas sp. 009811495]WDT86904.1 DUF4365 domain-containing protein [Alteromonas sp. 009811495]
MAQDDKMDMTMEKSKNDRARSDQTSRIGVFKVGQIVFSELGWIFREQSTSDYGIDAHFEEVDEGEPTGQLIAVQIKTGDSYFTETDGTGYVFRFSTWHKQYWLGHSLPTIVTLVHPTNELVFWQHINQSTVLDTGKGWKVVVPFTNRLTIDSRNQLLQRAEETVVNNSDSVIVGHNFPSWTTDVQDASVHSYLEIDQRELFSKASLDEPELLIAPMLNCMRNAKHCIHICAPFVDEDFIELLCLLSQFVAVKLITNDTSKAVIESYFKSPKVNSKDIEMRSGSDMHIKSIVIDNVVLFETSMTFVNIFARRSSDYHEFTYEIRESEVLKKYIESFDRLWTASRRLQLQS